MRNVGEYKKIESRAPHLLSLYLLIALSSCTGTLSTGAAEPGALDMVAINVTSNSGTLVSGECATVEMKAAAGAPALGVQPVIVSTGSDEQGAGLEFYSSSQSCRAQIEATKILTFSSIKAATTDSTTTTFYALARTAGKFSLKLNVNAKSADLNFDVQAPTFAVSGADSSGQLWVTAAQTVQLSTRNGSSSVNWVLKSGVGTLSASGAYVAPVSGAGDTVVEATDANGKLATATIHIGQWSTYYTNSWSGVNYLQALEVNSYDDVFVGGLRSGWTGSWEVQSTRDAGVTWTEDNYLKASGYASQPVSIATVPDSAVVFAVGSGADANGKYWVVRRSLDRGVTWSTVEEYQFASTHDSEATGAVVDESGNLYVSGCVHDETGNSLGIVKTYAPPYDSGVVSDTKASATDAYCAIGIAYSKARATVYVAGTGPSSSFYFRAKRGLSEWTDHSDTSYGDSFGAGCWLNGGSSQHTLVADASGNLFMNLTCRVDNTTPFVSGLFTYNDNHKSWSISDHRAGDWWLSGGIGIDRAGNPMALGRYSGIQISRDQGASWELLSPFNYGGDTEPRGLAQLSDGSLLVAFWYWNGPMNWRIEHLTK